MAKTIKQWVEDEIQDMRIVLRPGLPAPGFDEWIKYQEQIAEEIEMMYNNFDCWNNIKPMEQCNIVRQIIYELRMEEANGQN